MLERIKKNLRSDLWIVLLDIIAVNGAYLLALLIRFYVHFRFTSGVSDFREYYLRFTQYYTVLCNLHGIARYIPIWLVGALACVGIALGGMRLLADAGTLASFACITTVALAAYGVIVLPIIKPPVGGLMKGERG